MSERWRMELEDGRYLLSGTGDGPSDIVKAAVKRMADQERRERERGAWVRQLNALCGWEMQDWFRHRHHRRHPRRPVRGVATPGRVPTFSTHRREGLTEPSFFRSLLEYEQAITPSTPPMPDELWQCGRCQREYELGVQCCPFCRGA